MRMKAWSMRGILPHEALFDSGGAVLTFAREHSAAPAPLSFVELFDAC